MDTNFIKCSLCDQIILDTGTEFNGKPCHIACYHAQEETQAVEHPQHYGGKNNPYEAIKVIEAWHCGFNIGNAVKYISRAGLKGSKVEDLKKAIWYLQREINKSQ